MTKTDNRELLPNQQDELINILKVRFKNNITRHKGMDWGKIEDKLKKNTQKLWSLYEMEQTEGEPDVVGYDIKTDQYIFCDCSPESPKKRRSFCYDQDALNSRQGNKPQNSAVGFATEIGIELLNEEQYRELQKLEVFDTKTSSWLKTPSEIRKLGGAIFADFRYGKIFVYHNGAESYYSVRGFRGFIKV